MATKAGAGEGKDLVARLEAGHRRADSLDFSGQLRSKDRLSRTEDAEDETAEEPEPGWHFEASRPPIPGRDRRSVNPDQHLMDLGRWLRRLGKRNNVGRPVFRIDDGFHFFVS